MIRLETLLREFSSSLPSRLEREILSAYVLKKQREKIIAHSEITLTADQEKTLRILFTRRASGVPLAYLTNHREFYGLDFYVDERVLIPRPETEILVEEVLQTLPAPHTTYYIPHTLSIIDIGTGSGCIAIALAKNLPGANFYALDISPDALKVAHQNAVFHHVSDKITFIQSDLLTNFLFTLEPAPHTLLLVANLPYIGRRENNLIADDVLRHEPHEALFGGETGLELFQKLFSQVVRLEKRPTHIFLEIGFLQKSAISHLIAKYFGEVGISWKNDLAGLPRVCTITL